MGGSKVLGIIGLSTGWLFPIVGVVLGIIGLSIKKEKGKEDRDISLNIISLIEGIIAWIVWIAILVG
jgi:uncharacterized membrane protein